MDSIVGGAIPRQYIPAVQKGIEDTMANGGVHGFPVVDVKVQCYDGKYHNVDSSEMAFRTAASLGFKDALAKAGVVVEPISLLTVRVPAAYQGDVMGDINSRRGRVRGTGSNNGESEVTALFRQRRSSVRHRSAFDDRRARASWPPTTTTTSSQPPDRQGQGDPRRGERLMASSSPADLAVTFRSVDRRLREALDGKPRTMPQPCPTASSIAW